MTEQQPYELVRRYADFELRRYPAYTVAEVEVDGTFDRAGNAAFRHLFNYISGNNTSRQSVAMTAPVLQGSEPRKPQSQKVQMTAPVLQQGPLLGVGASRGGEADMGAYVVAFVLLPSARLARLLTRGRPVALQVPHRRGRLRVVSPGLVRRAHAAGVHVHVWTIDDPDEMNTLLDRGVDGIMTDRTDILRDVLRARGQWTGIEEVPMEGDA